MLDAIATPFGYLMKFFYQMTGNYAIALILFAILVKLVLLPISIRQQKNSVKQAELRPKERAIRKRYEGRTDQEARLQMTTELQQMYKDENYSLAGGCLPMLIQLPIIIILYNIVQNPLTYISRLGSEAISAVQSRVLELVKAGSITVSGITAESTAVSQIQATAAIRDNFSLFSDIISEGTIIPEFSLFGVDLSLTPTFAFTLIIIFPLLAGAFQWLSAFVLRKLSPPPSATDENGEKSPEAASAESTMKIMNVMMPLLTVWIAFKLPAVMSLYWIYQSVLGMLSQYLLYKFMPIPTFSEEYYKQVEEIMNKDYVPIPLTRTSTGRSLHRIDEDDDFDDETEPETYEADREINSEISEENESHTSHRAESAPRIRYDKNGNPIRSLHYIDFDEQDDEIEINEPQSPITESSTEVEHSEGENTSEDNSEQTEGPAQPENSSEDGD